MAWLPAAVEAFDSQKAQIIAAFLFICGQGGEVTGTLLGVDLPVPCLMGRDIYCTVLSVCKYISGLSVGIVVLPGENVCVLCIY